MDKFNENQRKAIDSKDPSIVILAPAGSGKTTTLVGAITEYKIQNPDARVAAITFTRKASDDLMGRLIGFDKIRVSTIHSWAYNELDKLSKIVREKFPDNTFKVKLLEEDKIKEILKEIIYRRGYKYLNMFQLYSYVMGNYNIEVPIGIKKAFEFVREDYIEYKQMYKLYDFTDLPQYLLDKLNDYDADIEGIDGLFVDEFQDVDDIQLELFNRTLSTKKFYIGDPQQSIYQFRGATPDVLRKLSGFKTHNLDINYRSYQEIIDYARTVQDIAMNEPLNFTIQKESWPSEIVCIKGYGGEVYTLNNSGATYKVNEYIRLDTNERLKHLLEFEPMILCRTNKQVREIKKIGYNNVSTVHQAKGLEFDTVILTQFDIHPDEPEEVNVAYVGMTRAENRLMVADFLQLTYALEVVLPTVNFKNNLF
ncbi:MAG: UvrD-helicase domain-containing protein [Nanoarchaeota archaeon]